MVTLSIFISLWSLPIYKCVNNIIIIRIEGLCQYGHHTRFTHCSLAIWHPAVHQWLAVPWDVRSRRATRAGFVPVPRRRRKPTPVEKCSDSSSQSVEYSWWLQVLNPYRKKKFGVELAMIAEITSSRKTPYMAYTFHNIRIYINFESEFLCIHNRLPSTSSRVQAWSAEKWEPAKLKYYIFLSPGQLQSGAAGPASLHGVTSPYTKSA